MKCSWRSQKSCGRTTRWLQSSWPGERRRQRWESWESWPRARRQHCERWSSARRQRWRPWLIPTWGRSCSWGFNWCHYPTPIDLGNSPVDRDGAHIATRLLGTKLEYRDGAHFASILAASGALQLLVSDQVEHRDESRVAVAAAPSRPLRLGLRLRGLWVQVEFRQKTGKLHEWRWLSIFIIFWQRSSN